MAPETSFKLSVKPGRHDAGILHAYAGQHDSKNTFREIIQRVFPPQLPRDRFYRISQRGGDLCRIDHVRIWRQPDDHYRKRVAKIDGPAEFHGKAVLKVVHSGERLEQVLAYLAVQLRVAGFRPADIPAKPPHHDLPIDEISQQAAGTSAQNPKKEIFRVRALNMTGWLSIVGYIRMAIPATRTAMTESEKTAK